MPCDDTLKCTTVAVGGEAAVRVSEMALEMAWGPVKDSISTELMYSTLHAGKTKEFRFLNSELVKTGERVCFDLNLHMQL